MKKEQELIRNMMHIITTVSYTHLDVYKRQVLACVLFPVLPNLRKRVLGGGCRGESSSLLFCGNGTNAYASGSRSGSEDATSDVACLVLHGLTTLEGFETGTDFGTGLRAFGSQNFAGIFGCT